MNRQNIIILILENKNDDDNIVQIVDYYQEDLFENELLDAHRILHVRNKNYYEIIVSQYYLNRTICNLVCDKKQLILL